MAIRGPLRRIFELDLRSLAVSRIALGFLSIVDCLFRLQNFEAHYSSKGVLPLSVLNSLYTPRGPCVHCWMPENYWGLLIFGIHILAAFCMMIGWKSRTSIFVTWLLTISLHYRNPLVIDGGDVLLRLMLLWLVFMPCSEYFSADSKNRKFRATQSTWWLHFILPLQLFCLYFFSAMLKTGADWWPLGTATGYALSLEAFVTPFGKWMTSFPEALKVLSRSVYLLELWGGFLLLSYGRFRMAGVLLFMGFHLGLALSMDLALFPIFACASLFALMPGEFWDSLKTRFQKIPVAFSNLRKSHRRNYFQYVFSLPTLALFLIGFSWNVFRLTKQKIPKSVARVGNWVHVDQYWGMFAPYPLKDSGWFEFGANLWNGEYLYTFITDSMEKEWNAKEFRPHQGNNYFIDQRWRKYLVNLWDKDNAKFRPYLAHYLCQKWNKKHAAPSQKLTKLDMEFVLFKNEEYLKTPRAPAHVDLGKYDCPEE